MATLPELIDTHAHLDGPEFAADLDTVLERAGAAGVTTIVTVGTDLASSAAAVALAERHPHLWATVGIHPHDAAGVTDEDFTRLRQLATGSAKVVAIGEVGLDFYRDCSPRDCQERVFRRSIALARELDLPLVVHDRDAHERILAILQEEGAAAVGGVLHCFSGDLALAKACLELGFLISIPGTVTYPGNEALRQVVRGLKTEQLLLETDCPYLAPVPFRGKRNEPAYTAQTAAAVAALKGLSVADVARITSLNARRLFRLGEETGGATIAYRIRDSLYLNITNRCSNRCTFCPKFDDYTVKGHQLQLDHEPDAAEVLAALGETAGISEVVFCGYGEPLVRLELVKEVAAELKRRGLKVRINTDGQANLVHGRDILPELQGLVDCLSVSLNAADAATYQRLCRTPFGAVGFAGVCDFLREAGRYVPEVVATAVTLPGLEIAPIAALAADLGVAFREREYAEVG